MKTRELIILNALKLFSINGYDGVSTSQIAEASNLVKSSLYTHFKKKEDILTSIFELYKELTESTRDGMERMDRLIIEMEPEEFWNGIIDQYLELWQQPPMIYISRIIVLEQFKNKIAMELLLQETQRILSLSEYAFSKMMEAGKIIPSDPKETACEFTYAIRGMLMEFDVLKAHGLDTEPIYRLMKDFIHSFCKKITGA